MRIDHLHLVFAAAAVLLVAGCTTGQGTTPLATSPASSDSAAQASNVSTSGMSAMSGGPSSATTSADASVGEKIWSLGQTPTGKITFLGGSPDVGNGACANCHGDKAQGGDGPMIGWAMLTSKSSTMKNMPKFSYSNPDQVYIVVTTGVRPDGSQVNPNMPRYDLSRADFNQLIAFLKNR